jgi:crotonobetainyl-CoA:carnitine CoA-transferase CaiB-like acyl-CoA transferase
MVATYQHPLLGQQRIARNYLRFGPPKIQDGRPTPLLGEHTREVLMDVGFSESAIAELYTKGVVRTEEPAGGC